MYSAMASVMSGEQGKSGSAAVSGITPSSTVAQRRLKARDVNASKFMEWCSNISEQGLNREVRYVK